MARVPDRAIVVFDEAYLEFAQGPDFPDTLNYLRHGRKVVDPADVLEGGEPRRAARGLRHGRSGLRRAPEPHPAAVQRQLASRRSRRSPHWMTSSHVLECVRMIEAGRHYLCDEFTALGLKYAPSRANFIFVDVGKSATNVFQWLLKEGVIVRPMTSFGMEHALRVTIGTPEENRTLRQSPQESAGRGQGRVIRRLALLGLGLLGGSVAKAARADGLAREIVAVGRRRESLEPALQDGTVDRITPDVAEGVRGRRLLRARARRWPRSRSSCPPSGAPPPTMWSSPTSGAPRRGS